MASTSNEVVQAFSNFNIEVDTHQLEYLEGENLKIKCTNSSDFIVGKQTTFNGPVTIINCDTPENLSDNKSEERVVIRDKVLTQSATNTVQNRAVKEGDENDEFLKSKKIQFPEFLVKDFFKIPVGAWIVMTAVFLGAVITIGVYFVQLENQPNQNTTARTQETIVAPDGKIFNLITREEWKALPPVSRTEINLPVPYVVISHTGGRMCYNQETCMIYIRDIQKYHINLGMGDIAYNFLVGGDGNIYEGIGWYHRSRIKGFANNKNVDINFIGDFSTNGDPTKPQVEAVKALIDYGLNNSMIAEDFCLIAANSTSSTLSPGQNVYKIIKTWPNFDPEPEKHIEQTESKNFTDKIIY